MFEMLIGKLLGSFSETAATVYLERKRLKHELEMTRIKGKIAYEVAKIDRAMRSEGLDQEWELESIKNSGYKDEWVLFLISIPMVLSFFPQTVVYVQMGFAALEQTPDWYQWLIMMILPAAYGIRTWKRNFLK